MTAANPHSPTSTEKYLRCPRLYYYGEQGYEPRGAWQPFRTMGSAVAKGQEVYYLGGSADDAWRAAEGVLEQEFTEGPEYTIEGLKAILAKGLKVCLAKCDEVMAREHVLAVEMEMGECRPDLITRHKTTGELIVTDGKVAYEIRAQYVPRRLREYETAHQFGHYAWRVGEHYGEPVKWTRAHLTILTPKATSILHLMKWEPERTGTWLEGAVPAWSRMETARNLAAVVGKEAYEPRWPECDGKYGRCPMFDGCHTFHGDERRFVALYDKLERGKGEQG